ncbi:PREDICTED: uncharacterized protein LOC105362674 [Ceratosolen solmsi marchali]|uniref:Uncharacterized protein LOC105362674 n=1 Tax=Ceratosolen solmsi marchali TaxID=326594 RepID=A0AAJ6YI26_9HYME|nr:PREDICTED: uncharacterized protein LOC105362674 [Ceratosolen solmsi marchali]
MEFKENSIQYEVVLRDPQSVLQKQLGNDLKVIDFKTKTFLQLGDNYGSTILDVQVKIKRKNDAEEEKLDLVAKMLPPTEFQRIFFETQISFKKEIFVYENLIPTYCSLYNGVFDITPKLYGSRISITADVDEVENDAVILMENLKVKGYCMEDRHKGLSLAHIKMTILSLAKFHAIGLSIKHKKRSYLPTLQRYMKPMIIINDVMKPFITNVLDVIQADPDLKQYYDRIKRTGNFENISDTYYNSLNVEHPWACAVHSDLWVNNVLFYRNKLEGQNVAKFIDFQMSYISSPLSDLIFFLCISMERSLSHIDEMIELYRLQIIDISKELGCAVEQFSKEKFDERLKIDAANELYHILLMLKVVELPKNEQIETSLLNDNCIFRLKNIIRIYTDKNWI